MLKYYPYPANDGKHKYYIITKSGMVIVILQFIKMKQDVKDMLIGTRKMKIGQNLA